MGHVQEAIAKLEGAVARNRNLLGPHRWLASTYGELGKGKEARAEVEEVIRINPIWSSRPRQLSPHG